MTDHPRLSAPTQLDRIESLMRGIYDLLQGRPATFPARASHVSGSAKPMMYESYEKGLVIKAGPASIYPNPALTPGATNPQVTQETIKTTIAISGWTATIRPPVSTTSVLKAHIMARDGLTGDPAQWELDHLISLELGGHPSDLKNLWCQPYSVGIPPEMGAHEKDRVENYLKQQVVSGALTLAEAQQMITDDWYAVYLSIKRLGLLPAMIVFDPDGSSDPDDD